MTIGEAVGHTYFNPDFTFPSTDEPAAPIGQTQTQSQR